MDRIEIPLSKRKITLALVVSIIFIALGILFIVISETFSSSVISQTTVLVIGVISILIFGTTSFYSLKKIFDNAPGLMIDEQGIRDTTSASSVGLIEWEDIEKIKRTDLINNKVLFIFVSRPEKYLSKVDPQKRKLLLTNMKIFGTPLSITVGSLKCKANYLEKLLNECLETKKSHKSESV